MKLKKQYFILLILFLIIAVGAVGYSTYSFLQAEMEKEDDTPATIVEQDPVVDTGDQEENKDKEEDDKEDSEKEDDEDDKKDTNKKPTSSSKPSTSTSNSGNSNNSSNSNTNNNTNTNTNTNTGVVTPTTPDTNSGGSSSSPNNGNTIPSTPSTGGNTPVTPSNPTPTPTPSVYSTFALDQSGVNYSNITLTQTGSTDLTFKGDLTLTPKETANLAIRVIITAPDSFPDTITSNSKLVYAGGQTFNSIVLGKDSTGKPYTIFDVPYINGSSITLAIDWGNGTEITYTINFDLNITTIG